MLIFLFVLFFHCDCRRFLAFDRCGVRAGARIRSDAVADFYDFFLFIFGFLWIFFFLLPQGHWLHDDRATVALPARADSAAAAED
jgi:hypothetical protein